MTISRATAARLGAAAVVAATVLGPGGAAAFADTSRVDDPAGDMTALDFTGEVEPNATAAPDHRAMDVTAVVLRHGARAVTLTTTFAKMRRVDENWFGGSIRAGRTVSGSFFVHDPANHGPMPGVFVMTQDKETLCRSADVSVDYRTDTIRVRIPRTCLEHPSWVAVEASSHHVADTGVHYVDDAFNPEAVDGLEYAPMWSSRVHAPGS